jgi:uncharacterized protein DUF4345
MNGSDRIARHREWIAALLLVLGVPQAVIGLWALLAPHSFYKDFPRGGTGWVETLGAYDEHLVRDVGTLFLGLGVLLIIAAARGQRSLSVVATVIWLIYALPHTLWHYFNLGPYSAGDAIANVITLGWQVLGGVVLLVLLRNQEPARQRAG